MIRIKDPIQSCIGTLYILDASLPIGLSSSSLNRNGAPPSRLGYRWCSGSRLRDVTWSFGSERCGASTRWIILSFWIGCGSDSVLVVACLDGSGRSLWAAPSRCCICVGCHPSVDWISAFRRVRFSPSPFPAVYCRTVRILINRKGLVAHSYADDTQVHLSVPASESPVAARQFSECIEEIDGWMRSNRLRMNTDKTQLIWIGTRQQLSKVDINESN